MMKKVFKTVMKVLVAATAICLLPVWGKEVKADDPKLYGVLQDNGTTNHYDVTFYYDDQMSTRGYLAFPYRSPVGAPAFDDSSVEPGTIVWMARRYKIDNPSAPAEFPAAGDIEKVDKVTFDPSVQGYHGLTSTKYLFGFRTNHGGVSEIVNIQYLDTSNVTDMSDMFSSCTIASAADLNNVVMHLNTSNVTNMQQMFYCCESSGALDLSNFDTSKVTDMKQMFCDALNLTSIDLSSFDTGKVTNMNKMFANSPVLKTIWVSEKWSTKSVDNTTEGAGSGQGPAEWLFHGSSSLVGGNGTKYVDIYNSGNLVDVQYAVIDGLNGQKGYLTDKYPKAKKKHRFSVDDILALFGTPESNMESAIERPVEIQPERDTYKSCLPSKSILAGSVTDKLYELKAHEMSETDSRNQQLLANAFVAQGQDNPIFAGKTPKLIAEFGIYPNRELTAQENGSKQVLTWNTFSAQTPGPVFAVCYNETDKAYVIYGTMDANGVAKLNDFILRPATNISLYKIDI